MQTHSRIFAAPELDTPRPRVSLDGRWEFSFDPQGRGSRDNWFAVDFHLPERITLPGCPQVRRYPSARSDGTARFEGLPEHSQTVMLRHGCMHPAWYKRRFTPPAEWHGREIWLHIGGVHPAATFWVNGQPLGQTLTSRSPVRINLTGLVRLGETNTLAAMVDWPEQRLDGLFDCVFAWSGFYRSLWVEAAEATHIIDVHAMTTIDPPGVTLEITLSADTVKRKGLRIACEVTKDESSPLPPGEGGRIRGARARVR